MHRHGCPVMPLLLLAALLAVYGATAQTIKKPCELASDKKLCNTCIAGAKKSKDPITNDVSAMICGVCGSLSNPSLRQLCASCVANHEGGQGCAGCGGRAFTAIAEGRPMKPAELSQAESCFECYAKGKPEARGSYGCVSCWLAEGVKEREACSGCVAAASTDQQAGTCSVCNGPSILATEKQCYECMGKTKFWQAKGLCGLSPAPKQDVAISRALLPDFFGCIAGAPSDMVAQLCVLCLPSEGSAKQQSANLGAGRACFKCLSGVPRQSGLKPMDMYMRGGACALKQ